MAYVVLLINQQNWDILYSYEVSKDKACSFIMQAEIY